MATERVITNALQHAFSIPVTPERGIGCCRVYVTVSKGSASAVAKAAQAINKTFQRKAHYGMTNALYIGYDNCDGIELARGTAVVRALQALGIDCSRQEHGD